MIIEKYNNIGSFPASLIKDTDQRNKNLFKKLKWFDLLQKHIIQNNEDVIYYCVLNDNKDIEAVFPLIKTHIEGEDRYNLSSLANFYSMEYEPYFRKKERNCQKAIQAFVEYLATSENHWETLSLFPIDPCKIQNIYLKEEFLKYFMITNSLCHKNWIYHNNNEDFKKYATFSPSRIKDIERKERQLLKKHTIKFKIWSDETDLDKVIKDYFEVYNNSWKDEERYKDFIPDLIKLCAKENMLRLGIIYVDDRATAAQFNIFHDKITLIYKLSYHEDYKHLSTGAILSYKMMQHAFDQDHTQEVDYGSGDDGYKKEWMNYCREKMTITAYNNNSSGKYHYFKRSWKARIKQFFMQHNDTKL